MKPVSPVIPGSEHVEVVLARDQPQYIPLPVVYLGGKSAPMVSRWRLSLKERLNIAMGADLVLTQLTFGQLFQPVHLQIVTPGKMPVLMDQ